MAIINPTTIAQFFHITDIAIMNYLIAFSRKNDLLRLISHHYAIVEINTYSILHLYYILWLSRNLSLKEIRTWLLKDGVYIFWMMIHLDIMISCYIDETILQVSILLSTLCISLFSREYKSDFNWHKLINHDSNAIAAIKQMHSFSHNTIYFKYTPRKIDYIEILIRFLLHQEIIFRLSYLVDSSSTRSSLIHSRVLLIQFWVPQLAPVLIKSNQKSIPSLRSNFNYFSWLKVCSDPTKIASPDRNLTLNILANLDYLSLI